jgi:hypothetical protein
LRHVHWHRPMRQTIPISEQKLVALNVFPQLPNKTNMPFNPKRPM